MRTVRAVLAALVVFSLVGLIVPPAEALEPFPDGDDDIRAFIELPGAVCGQTITTTSQTMRFENIPAGVQYYIRYIDGGVLDFESGPFIPVALGTYTLPFGGFEFDPGPYPRTVGMMGRIEIGGESTYIGGTLITCASSGATPVVEEIEIFLPPCGVGDAHFFPDVPASSSFCEDVQWTVDTGVAGGYPDGTFRPTEPVTRQTMAAFLHRLDLGVVSPPPCSSPPFPDVSISNPFCGAIQWAAGSDIASGFPDGTFRPTTVVSRQAMAAFLYRDEGSPLGEDPACSEAAFSDVSASHPFCGEIRWLADEGISGGFLDGTFRPNDPVSRQSMAAFLHRR